MQHILDFNNLSQKLEISEDSEILGVFIIGEHVNVSAKLEIVHKLPNLKSLTEIKVVLLDHAIFNLEANLQILKGAKNTDAYLKISVLMLSDNAKAKAVPALEITENEVKGGHGATVGKPNAEQMFYLQSKGFSTMLAKQEIAYGFLAQTIEKIADTNIKQNLYMQASNLHESLD